jgi:hypothetical protein
VVAPRERVQLTVLARDAALSDSRPVAASATASLVSNRGSENVRLWPDDRAGTFTGSARAPATPGVYRLAVAVSGARAELPIIVASDASSPAPDAIDLVRAWVASRGGVALAATDAGSLASRLAAAIHPAERPVTWHPMRSAWWILPFAFALAAEWWLRRRRGLL